MSGDDDTHKNAKQEPSSKVDETKEEDNMTEHDATQENNEESSQDDSSIEKPADASTPTVDEEEGDGGVDSPEEIQTEEEGEVAATDGVGAAGEDDLADDDTEAEERAARNDQEKDGEDGEVEGNKASASMGDDEDADEDEGAAEDEGEKEGEDAGIADTSEDDASKSDGDPENEQSDAGDEGDDGDRVDDASSSSEVEADGESTEAALDRAVLASRFEGLIFTSPEPLTVRKIARVLAVDGKVVREIAAELTEHYKDRGIILEEISKGFQFRSHPDNAAMIRDVFKLKPLKISRAALEALAIVAYRQPLTRAEVEEIRGVDSGGVLKYLFEKELVRVIGRKEEPGRPIIYGTSKAFLELFGLKSLADLPALHEFSELWEEHQKIVDEEAPLSEDVQGADSGVEAEKAGDEPPAADVPDSDEEQTEVPDSDEEQTVMDDKKEEANENNEGAPADPSEIPTETLDPKELEDIMKNLNTEEADAGDSAPSGEAPRDGNKEGEK